MSQGEIRQHMPSEWFLNDLWARAAGKKGKDIPLQLPALETLKATQWSEVFEKLMRNRLVMGAVRYGLINEPGKVRFDRISNIIKRCEIYQETGNDELLVDIANMAALEFEEGIHPLKHICSVDDGNTWHAKEIGK